MSVGDAWAGLYSYSTISGGTWTVLPWTNCAVLINKVNVTGMFYCENTRTLRFGAGGCVIRASDPDWTQYNLFQTGNEIEIYMNDQNVANKVWGGYLENNSITNSTGKEIVISGKEYANRLLKQDFTDAFSNEELSTALTSILANQTDFTNDIAVTTDNKVYGTFTKATMHYAIQKFCDQFDYDFLVNTNKVFQTKLKTEVDVSADTILAGTNVTRNRKETYNQEYLCNDVTVKGASGVASQHAEDATSKTSYGVYSKQITAAGIDNTAALEAYAKQYVSDHKDPRPNQVIETKLLPNAEPREHITTTIPSLGMSGNYKIQSITHKWGKGQGTKSEVELSNLLATTSQQIGDYQRRISDLEGVTF